MFKEYVQSPQLNKIDASTRSIDSTPNNFYFSLLWQVKQFGFIDQLFSFISFNSFVVSPCDKLPLIVFKNSLFHHICN